MIILFKLFNYYKNIRKPDIQLEIGTSNTSSSKLLKQNKKFIPKRIYMKERGNQRTLKVVTYKTPCPL